VMHFREYPVTHFGGLKTHKIFSQDRSLSRDCDPGPSKYEADVQTTAQRLSAHDPEHGLFSMKMVWENNTGCV
jgi:hypothetical protein